MAYDAAQKSFVKDGINRILLATDGDFNVCVSNFETLKGMVAEKRKAGVSLTTLGFGTGNYNEPMMEQLADAGDGNYSYIDSEKDIEFTYLINICSLFSVEYRTLLSKTCINL